MVNMQETVVSIVWETIVEQSIVHYHGYYAVHSHCQLYSDQAKSCWVHGLELTMTGNIGVVVSIEDHMIWSHDLKIVHFQDGGKITWPWLFMPWTPSNRGLCTCQAWRPLMTGKWNFITRQTNRKTDTMPELLYRCPLFYYICIFEDNGHCNNLLAM